MKTYKNQLNVLRKIFYLFNNPLNKYIAQLKYQYFNYKLLHWALLLIIVISVFWSMCNIISWIKKSCSALSYIIVTGKCYYTTNDDIYRMIKNLGIVGTLIAQDINVIQKEIERLPWIKTVSIRKQWPDTLKIHIMEHIPVALWNDSQAINIAGTIFRIPKICQNNKNILIPILYGPKGSEQAALIHYYIFNEILTTSIKLEIQSVHMDMRYSWKLILKNNMYVKLGSKNIVERLNYFVKIYPILLYKMNENNQYIDYVDLRYTTGFVVKWMSTYDHVRTL